MTALEHARRNLRRDHIRHRLNNLAVRLNSLSIHTHALDDVRCDRLEDMLARIEDAMNMQADA